MSRNENQTTYKM